MKQISSVLALVLMLLALVGAVSCGGTPEETEPEIYMEIDYDQLELDQYVKLGRYKGLTINLAPVSINMNIIESAMQEIIDKETTKEMYDTPVTDRLTEKGDYVEISYKAYFDGELYIAGSADSVSLLLDDNNGFFEWLDDDLYGIMPGTTVETVGKLPDSSYYGEYAGKEGTFVITLAGITGHYYIPELTDEMVAKYTEYATVDEYGNAMYEELYAEAEAKLEDEKISSVWSAILKSSEILEYPEQQVMYYYTSYRSNIEAEADIYGHAYEEHLQAIGLTDEDVMLGAKELVAEELIFYAIVKAEGYAISDEEYAEGVVKYAEQQEMTVEQLETYYAKEYIVNNLLWDKVFYELKDMTNYTFE